LLYFRKAKGKFPVAKANTPNILNGKMFQLFWVSWLDGKISVGEGVEIGHNVIVDYIDPSPIEINYLSVTGYDKPGIFLTDKGI
jgi:Farnesoic acid 0-methyl transferase